MTFLLSTLKEHLDDLTIQTSLKWLIRGLVIAALVLLSLGNVQSTQKLRALEAEYESQSQQLTETLQRAQDQSVTKKELEAQLDQLIADNDRLREDIKDLKSRPTSAGTIVITQPGTVEEFEGGFPPEHTYRLADGMPVARHTFEAETFTAETYDLDVAVTVVTTEDREGKKYTYIDSTMSSSATEERFPVDVTADFSHVKPSPSFKLLDPHVNLGVSLPIPEFSPRASIGISTTSIGPTTYDNSVRFSNIKIEAGKSLAVGIDPVGVNVSKLANIPLIQDTWLWAGTAVEVLPDTGSWAVTVGVGSTL